MESAKAIEAMTGGEWIPVTEILMQKIKDYMLRNHLSLRKYSQIAGVDPKTLTDILKGYRKTTSLKVLNPYIAEIERIAQKVKETLSNDEKQGALETDLEGIFDNLKKEAIPEVAKQFSLTEFNLKKNIEMPQISYDLFIIAKLFLGERLSAKPYTHRKVADAFSSGFYHSANKKNLLAVYSPLAKSFVESAFDKKSIVKLILYSE